MPDTVGRRERNKRERRKRLEDVALELFERDGFEKTTIEQIADRAGLAPRTFFSYFATKDDLVLADYNDRLDRILDELEQRPLDEDPWRALQA
jgi:AcrR family transcriptional regulator